MKKVITTFVIIAGFFAMAVGIYAADSTVVVMGDTSAGENQPGWLFNRDVTTSTPYEFILIKQV